MTEKSTTQKLTKATLNQEANENDPFIKELTKKIRNKQKKVDQIKQLEDKVKAKEIDANEEQRGKIASKPAVVAEIAEIKIYLDLYKSSIASKGNIEKELAKQHQKELQQAKTSAVRNLSNIVTIFTMMECGQTMPEELEEGAKHFSECFAKLLGKG